MKTKALMIIAAILAAAAFAGCTSTTYSDPSGATFKRSSFLNRQNIGKVEMKAGDKVLVIEGYSNEQTEIAAAVAGSVAKALVPATK
jgi:hypothetical protein